jgi:hypothetical protein
MESNPDFEDMLSLLEEHDVRYLIVGGFAFAFHAKPRSTKDIDIWIEPSDPNIHRANQALAEFGSPTLLDVGDLEQVVQLGVAPNRIDFLLDVGCVGFEEAWTERVRSNYGDVVANWISLDCLIRIKQAIDNPRHQEDVRVLRQAKRLRGK